MAKNKKEAVEILGGKETMYTYDYRIRQFRLWLTTDNKYVRKARGVLSRVVEYIERWKQVCKENNKELEGYVFSINGKEFSRSNFHRHRSKTLKLDDNLRGI